MTTYFIYFNYYVCIGFVNYKNVYSKIRHMASNLKNRLFEM